jgi:hypothetical protein
MTEPNRPTEGTTNKSPTYLLVQEKVGKDPIDWMREKRDASTSWRAISYGLLSEYGVNVTDVTLRKWWDDANKEPEPATT